MSQISEQASIHPSARIGRDVIIGPFCVIGPGVELGDECELKNNVTLDGRTRIGKSNVFYPYTAIGVAPQDLKYAGGDTETIIGDRNVFRESVTVHRGTELAEGRTVIGNGNFLMVGAHVAHDCVLEDHVLLSNLVMLAGHVRIESGAIISAMVGVHHFVTIGRNSYIGAMTPVRRDVPPFVKVNGDPPEVVGLNTEGLKRNGFTSDDLEELKGAFKQLFRAGKNGSTMEAEIEKLLQCDDLNDHVRYLRDFVHSSCQSRFWRAMEARRRDRAEDRMEHSPYEVRTGKGQEQRI